MSAWDKLQMGWLNYDAATYGQKSNHKLASTVKNAKQAVVIKLPTEQNQTDTNYGTPTSGTKAYWSGSGANLDRKMLSPSITIPAGTTSLSMKVWYAIETCWDYAYVQVVDGATVTNLMTSQSDLDDANEQNEGGGITGISGLPDVCDAVAGNPTWVDLTADLSAFAGKTVKLQIRYWTDGFVDGRGIEWDDLKVTNGATTVFSDDAEGSIAWDLGGWVNFPGFTSKVDDHYYVAEYRTRRDYDKSLATAYNFGFLGTNRPDWVETHPYTEGMLVWYWDLGYTDNSTSVHPGQGEALPVDSHPTPLHWADGQLMRGRISAADSAFGFNPVPGFTLNKNGEPTTIAGQAPVSVFNDLQTYWYAGDGHSAASHGRHQVQWQSVNVPKTGTQIAVKNMSEQDGVLHLEVSSSK